MLRNFSSLLTNRPIILHNRNFTSIEVSTALRPFYFAVHPDLFGKYPSERATNESSLQQLSSILEKIQKSKSVPPVSLSFYVKDKAKKTDKFRFINIDIQGNDIRTTLCTILKSCDLPTDYVDSIIPPPPPSADNNPNSPNFKFRYKNEIDLTKVNQNHPIYAHIKMQMDMKRAQELLRLRNYLKKYAPEALKKSRKGDIHRVLIFSSFFTGVSLDGHIMLYSGEVRHNWLDFLKNIDRYDAALKRIPAFEKSLSHVLRKIKIGRRKFMPKIVAGQYENNLRQITTSLSDYIGLKPFPVEWPSSLENFEIVVETEAGPLMVSPTGQFIVPATIPGSLLVNFITTNLEEASKKIVDYKSNKYLERALNKKCIEDLQLAVLSKDDNITPDLMIKCCEQLIKNKYELQSYTKDLRLNITTYYSVLSDGVVCIPWNFDL
ncbi:T-cell activation inhibitor, mitochondrial isoform X2 [Diabrotica virgifera virgifera]|uniref:T-cell activation inhibitor, mitochondrial n=1 Tax=Diabrotica virgifera virgifera TaxID=50390 RepID=A0ABM5I9L4_DIAVI|nr:T-cell activation inhibitor, mitochondrial isoform X2 [Diabrotica virgifera virgifera]